MKDLIEKLKNDRLSSEEFRELKQFFDSASDEEIAALFPESPADDASGDVPYQMISRMKRRVDAAIDRTEVDSRRFGFYRKAAIAAAVVVPLLLAGLALSLILPGHGGAEPCVIASGEGESSSVSLSDGSMIALNENSSLTIDGFSDKDRSVRFDGEAYFDIARDSSHPFRISTPAMTIEVYGTSFNLLSRPGSNFAEVSLDEGKVELKAASSGLTVTLEAGRSALLDTRTGTFTVSDLNTATSSWKNNELLFHQAPPEYVVERLEQTYGVSIDPSVRNSMDKAFTGMLPSDNFDEAMIILSSIYDIESEE